MIEQSTKQAIVEAIGGKILRHLQDTPAVEVNALEQAIRRVAKTTTVEGTNSPNFHVTKAPAADPNRTETITTGYTMLPKSVYDAALKNLGTKKMIRKVKLNNGTIFIARKDATPSDLMTAAKLNIQANRDAQRNLYNKNKHNQLAKSAQLVEEVHYSETPTFGDSYQQALTAHMDDAILATSEAKEFPVAPVHTDTINDRIGENQAQLIERQIASGQSRRNAIRATKRRKQREANNDTTYNFKTNVLRNELDSNIKRTKRLMEDQLAHTY